MDRALLASYGIDYDAGLKRCANNAAFYRRMLHMFLEDDSFQRAKRAFEAGDTETLFGCMHELKGVAGNIAMSTLFGAASPMVELLRGGAPDAKCVADAFAAVERAYLVTREGVEIALAQE